jgi:teichuronic acid exporter
MDLKIKAIKSTAWYIGTRVWMQALSWGVTLILARILAPADYGLFAMAFTVVTILDLLQEFGLGVSIVQRQDLSREQINAIFWFLFAVSLAVVALMFVGAEYGVRFYREPRLIWIIRILSLVFLINSLGVVPYSLLTKEIDFRARSLAEAAGVVASAVVSLGVAYAGYGVWALIYGQLSRAIVKNLAMFISSKWLPGLAVSFTELRDILKFSLRIASATSLGSITDTITNAIIGKFLGGYSLGLYSVAIGLGQNNPLNKVSGGVISQLSFPLFSKLQNDIGLLQKYFLQITRILAIVSLPLQIGLALVAHDLVVVLLSDKWIGTVRLVQIFAIGGIFQIVTLPSASLLMARGRSDCIFQISLAYAIGLTSAFLVAVNWGLIGAVAAWLVIFIPIRIWLLLLSLRELRMSAAVYALAICRALFASIAMTIVVILVQLTLGSRFSETVSLATEVGAGAISYLGCLLLVDRKLSIDLRTIVREMRMVTIAG